MKQFESFELDTSNECLWHEGVQIALASKPFSVLRYLVENSGRLITHDELMDALWPTTYVQPQVLRTYVLELRKVLGDDAKHPKFIQTVPKRGYSFIASVKENADPTNGKPPGRSGRDVSPTELVGRDGELVYLLRLAQLAASAQRQLVFIAGEAGIGKTSLLNAFREALDVELSQAYMAWGHCVEGLSEKEDYYPVFEAIGQCIDLAHQEGGLAAQFAWRRTLQNKPGKLCEALEEIARAKAFIIVIEDIQWADQCTVDLISALARRGTPAKLLVIATYRPHDRATNLYLKSMKQDLVVRHLCNEIALEPLSKQSTKELVSRRLDRGEVPTGLDTFIYQRSAGNPLFARALLEHMIAERLLVRNGGKNEGRWEQLTPISEIEACVPNGLAMLIELEIDRLSPMEQRVLEAGSLMNIAFPVWAVAAALKEDPEHIEELCNDLERRTGLVRRAGHDDLPDGTRCDFYSFAHEFYREVVYQRQTTGRRATGHIRIAEQLGALFSGREADVAREIAMQYESAGNWQRAVHALRAGARRSFERHAYQASTELLEHVLRIAENMSHAERDALVKETGSELDMVREMIARMRPQQQKAS